MAEGDWIDIDGSRATEIIIQGPGDTRRWVQLSVEQRSALLALVNHHPLVRDAIIRMGDKP